jgi:hypothetical protein
MRTWVTITITLVLGCGNGSDDALAKMRGFRDRVCACADKACAEVALDEMETYFKEQFKGSPNADQRATAEALSTEMTACLAKLDGK